ncbi:MAG: fatty acid desaturase [Moraxellaceae bacterium]|jgi:fatty acid desaturase|nr:fatty acid desaturase [Moraxellaceae bacterium]
MTLRYRDGLVPNLLAGSYAIGGYALGLFLITRDAPLALVAGTLLLGHAMVIAAFLFHECAHNTIFASNKDNARLGNVLIWICGGIYCRYEQLRHKHFRHHVDRADVVAYDYRPVLARHPQLVKLITALEWAYVPALDIYHHVMVLVLPFTRESREDDRTRVAGLLLLRVVLFAALGLYAPLALPAYFVAWMLMLTVLRFMDAFQHSYEVAENLDSPRAPLPAHRDAAFEVRNTFTNLHSLRHPWLNLFTLNFGYHNAHHEKPAEPWHHLPALHAQYYGEHCPQNVPFSEQLAAYHRHRLTRVLSADAPDSNVLREHSRHFVGADGVSFLVGH